MNEKTIHDFCNSKNMGKGIHYNISSNINLFLSEEWLLTYWTIFYMFFEITMMMSAEDILTKEVKKSKGHASSIFRVFISDKTIFQLNTRPSEY